MNSSAVKTGKPAGARGRGRGAASKRGQSTRRGRNGSSYVSKSKREVGTTETSPTSSVSDGFEKVDEPKVSASEIAKPGQRRLIVVAASGTGKTYLAKRYPNRYVDADDIYSYPKGEPEGKEWWRDASRREEIEKKNGGIANDWYKGPDDGKILLVPTDVGISKIDGIWRRPEKFWKFNLADRKNKNQPGVDDYPELEKTINAIVARHPEAPVVGAPKLVGSRVGHLCSECKVNSAVSFYGHKNAKCKSCFDKDQSAKKEKQAPGNKGVGSEAVVNGVPALTDIGSDEKKV